MNLLDVDILILMLMMTWKYHKLFQTAIHLQLCALQCTRFLQKRFQMLLPEGSGFDCGTDCGTGACTDCGTGSCVSVPHDVLGSGRFTFRSLSFIFPSLTADILSNQWVFWITSTSGSDRCGANTSRKVHGVHVVSSSSSEGERQWACKSVGDVERTWKSFFWLFRPIVICVHVVIEARKKSWDTCSNGLHIFHIQCAYLHRNWDSI